MRNAAETIRSQVKHLRVPRVCAQWPPVTVNNRPTLTPILIINSRAVFCYECAHAMTLLSVGYFPGALADQELVEPITSAVKFARRNWSVGLSLGHTPG